MHSNIVGVRSVASRASAASMFILSALAVLILSHGSAYASISGVTFVKVHAGQSTNCALANTGSLYCWGANDYGQLLDGSTNSASTPELLNLTSTLGASSIMDFANGSGTTCILATGSHVYCWGYGGQGQIGNGSFALAHAPAAVSFSGLTGTINQIAGTGSTSFCVLTSSSQIWCWGGNVDGSLGNGTITNSDVPVAVERTGVLSGKTINTLAGSAGTYCVLDNAGKAYCWGNGLDGALGNGTKLVSKVPVAVLTNNDLAGKTLTAIAASSNHTCALDAAHQLYCWGTNKFGTNGLGLPDGSTNTSSAQLTPKHVSSMSSVSLNAISSGGTESCATSTGGALYCWGGEPVGDGYTINDALSPVHVNGGMLGSKVVTAASSGDYNTCAIDSDGSLYCWGVDDNNQIGDNSTATSYYPNEIAISPSASSVATTPGAPRGVTQSSSAGSISVSWTGSFNDGGSPITSYVASASDGTNTFSCSGVGAGATGCTINSLVNGTPYDVSLIAKNTIGSSSVVHAGSATPITLPDPPTAVNAVPASQALKVLWQPGASNGGTPITGYTAAATILSTTKTCTVLGSSSTTCTISGLLNGANYTVTVTATNAVGASSPSASSNATPASVPGAPTAIKVTASNGSVLVSWTAPVSNGGSPVTTYNVTASPGGASCNVVVSVTQCSVKSLVASTGYTFNVTAKNVVGPSVAASSIVTYPFSATSLSMLTASAVLSKGASFKIILAGSSPNSKATVAIGPSMTSCIFNAAHQCTVTMSIASNGTFRAVAKVGGTPATLALYVPLVSIPAKTYHKKSFKITITNCPPNKFVQLSFSGGQKVSFFSNYKGIAIGTVAFAKSSTITMTTSVAGTVLSPNVKIKII